MTRFKILGAAAILSLMSATPVFAQAAIQEPGLFALRRRRARIPRCRCYSAATPMPPWTAAQMVLLAPGGTVPMIRLQERSSDMMVVVTPASKLAPSINQAPETGRAR